jgi:heme A synthase
MRHTQAGLNCDDWPACYGRIVASSADGAAGTEPAPSTGVRLARIAHRLAATSVLALVIGLLLVAWTQKPAWTREGRLAGLALVVAGGLAVLGIATPGAMLPAVTLGKFAGGYLMLALLIAT